jgi:hypothetical protein
MLQTVIRLCSVGVELDRISLAEDDDTGMKSTMPCWRSWTATAMC